MAADLYTFVFFAAGFDADAVLEPLSLRPRFSISGALSTAIDFALDELPL